MLKNQIEKLNETAAYSEKYYWRQASLYNTLKCFINVWSEQAKKCRNKTERKQYAVTVLELVEKYNEQLQKEKARMINIIMSILYLVEIMRVLNI